jgi:hypothetical protein
MVELAAVSGGIELYHEPFRTAVPFYTSKELDE